MPKPGSVWGSFFVVVSSQTPEASSSRAGDLCSLSHNWTAAAWSFQDRGNAISLLDIENAFGDGCQHVNSLAMQLSASQLVFVTAGGCRLPTTFRNTVSAKEGVPDPVPDCSPELSPWVKANIRQCQPPGTAWGILPGSLPPPVCHPPDTDREVSRAQAAQHWPGTPIHHEAPILAVPQQLQRCKTCSTAYHMPVLNTSPHTAGAGLGPAMCPVRGTQLTQELAGSSLQGPASPGAWLLA